MLAKINNMYQNRFISKASAKVLHFFETNKKKSKNLQLEQGKGLLFPASNLIVFSMRTYNCVMW